MLLLLLRRRWIAAGVCMAVAVLLKPQGMFLAPIALIGAAIVPRAEAGKLGERTIIRAAKMVVAAGVAVAVSCRSCRSTDPVHCSELLVASRAVALGVLLVASVASHRLAPLY